jgi:hypothetical protein
MSQKKAIMSHIELTSGATYKIFNGEDLARNFPGIGQGPQMTQIAVGEFASIYSTWVIEPSDSEGAFNISNTGSGNKAYVRAEEKDAPVLGFSEKGTKFAIERAGNGEYVIKVVNKNLLWTVGDGGVIALAPANGHPTQRFRFERNS